MKPQVISDVELAFPAKVKHLMPDMKDIPEEFKQFCGRGTKWNQLFSDWFYSGLSKLDLVPKDGIDKNLALRHIRAVMGSFEPKHEHKEAAVAYLLSLWFTDESSWERKGK